MVRSPGANTKAGDDTRDPFKVGPITLLLQSAHPGCRLPAISSLTALATAVPSACGIPGLPQRAHLRSSRELPAVAAGAVSPVAADEKTLQS